MKKYLIPAVLMLATIGGTIAFDTAQAQAVALPETTMSDRRGDAPARIDLTKVGVQRQGPNLLVRVHLREFPRPRQYFQGYEVWLDSRRTQRAPDYTMRWFSQEYGSGRTNGWDVVTRPWNPYGVGHADLTLNRRGDYFTFSVPMRDLDWTKNVRVAVSTRTTVYRDPDPERDHLTAWHKFSDWVRVA